VNKTRTCIWRHLYQTFIVETSIEAPTVNNPEGFPAWFPLDFPGFNTVSELQIVNRVIAFTFFQSDFWKRHDNLQNRRQVRKRLGGKAERKLCHSLASSRNHVISHPDFLKNYDAHIASRFTAATGRSLHLHIAVQNAEDNTKQ
jgi:hypothetical protein